MNTTQSLETSTLMIINTVNDSTTSDTNMTTMNETNDDEDLEIWMIVIIATTTFLILVLLVNFSIKKKSRRETKKKTVPIMIQGSTVSKTLTTRDRKNSHVLYLEAPTDSIDPRSKKSSSSLSASSLALNALDRTQDKNSRDEKEEVRRTKMLNLNARHGQTVFSESNQCSSSIAMGSLGF